MKQSKKQELAQCAAQCLTQQSLTLSVAESCTGGMLSAAITSIPGASKFYKGGVCSYWNEIKHGVLGVRQETLDTYTAVSEQTAAEMASGCARLFGTDLSVSVTGYAGPDGGEDGTPVGTIYLGVCFRGAVRVVCIHEPSGRENARERACETAFALMLEELEAVQKKN